jgi:hypothetical protein
MTDTPASAINMSSTISNQHSSASHKAVGQAYNIRDKHGFDNACSIDEWRK